MLKNTRSYPIEIKSLRVKSYNSWPVKEPQSVLRVTGIWIIANMLRQSLWIDNRRR